MPTAIYFGERIMVFKNVKAIQAVLSIKRTALLEANYTRTAYRIIAESISAKNHLSAWVEFRHFDKSDGLITTSTSRYFCARLKERKLRVQLIEYLEIPVLKSTDKAVKPLVGNDHHSTIAPV
ncbi:hypothetical protein [Pseudosulfitobacter sp. SM2401]|uniref:hypothetical protein n=1 Tax=Pseudosulfitobacter sp. SM2401 TaxID=3350098 RepID=UPI0036F2DEC4